MTLTKQDYGSQNGDGGFFVFKDEKYLFGKSVFDDHDFDYFINEIKRFNRYDTNLLTKEEIEQIKKWINFEE